jgi:glyoxylase-like metal-dependent hydrolase (beta-lactamase superfamily II)
MLTRALFVGAATLIAAGALANTLEPHASTVPQVTGNADYYRMRVGDFEITALSDGAPAASPVNGYLINTGRNLLLIDTGAGTLLGPGLGKLVDNLRTAGFQPEQIDEIYITHVDPDHIGGLLLERKPIFARAVVRVARAAADYWQAKSSMAAGAAGAAGAAAERQRFAAVAATFKPYSAAGRLKTFDGETELRPGVRALPGAVGPAPGSTLYLVESRGERMVFWGDTPNAAAAKSLDQGAAIRFDTNTGAEAALRNALVKDGAEHGNWLAAARLPFPGVGHVRAAAHGLTFLPADPSAH